MIKRLDKTPETIVRISRVAQWWWALRKPYEGNSPVNVPSVCPSIAVVILMEGDNEKRQESRQHATLPSPARVTWRTPRRSSPRCPWRKPQVTGDGSVALKTWSALSIRPHCCDRPFPFQEPKRCCENRWAKGRQRKAHQYLSTNTARATNTDVCISCTICRAPSRHLGVSSDTADPKCVIRATTREILFGRLPRYGTARQTILVKRGHEPLRRES